MPTATIELGQYTKVKRGGDVTIPQEYLRALQLTPNSYLKVLRIGESIIMAPLRKGEKDALDRKIETYSRKEVEEMLAADQLH